jgi:histone deacetylase 11
MTDPTLVAWRARQRRSRRLALLSFLAVLAAFGAAGAWLVWPPPQPAARPGVVLPGGALVAAAHDPTYLAGLTDPDTLGRALEVAVPGFFSAAAIDRRVLGPLRRQVQGTVLAARGAVAHGLGINLGGGFHHARPDMGHGFCVYSDVAVAVYALREEGFTGRILVVDTDAHQGDGTHAFFAADPDVFSLSLHQGDIFPVPKLRGDRDVPLRAGTDDAGFLAALDAALAEAPTDVALVVHVAGADVLGDDPLAGLSLTPEGLVTRDLRVQAWARDRGIPLLHVLAGGYGPSAGAAQAESVAAMLRAARD